MNGMIEVHIPGLLPFLNHMKDTIMQELTDLKTASAALVAKVTETNAKVDALIVVANTTKDALVALQAAGTAVTAADLQAVIDQQNTALTALNTEEAKVDAATTAVAP